jgi:hypothetical protein
MASKKIRKGLEKFQYYGLDYSVLGEIGDFFKLHVLRGRLFKLTDFTHNQLGLNDFCQNPDEVDGLSEQSIMYLQEDLMLFEEQLHAEVESICQRLYWMQSVLEASRQRKY